MAKRFEERVTAYVEQQLESAFQGKGKGEPPNVPVGLAAKGLGIAALSLLMLVGVVIIAALLVKVVFF
jgi:hypothetical protein